MRKLLRSSLPVLTVAALFWGGQGCRAEAGFRFLFDASSPRDGFIPVSTGDAFSPERGYGFDLGFPVAQGGGSVTSTNPFFFSVALPEGNYTVKMQFGDAKSATTNTVKAEMRRLMLKQVITEPGTFVTREITVNIRTPAIPGDEQVRLKQRERDDEMINWDDKLTLEFNGSRPSLAALEIRRANVPTVFLLGDSTVCDQPREPWNSWGQMLPRFFAPGIAVANHAQSGESIKSSLSARRFDKVFAEMKPGDWMLVQFGHNDMKDKATNALATYKANLKMIVARTRAKGGTPVLVTSMERKAGVKSDTLARYPDAMREVAREDEVALIDLHATSKVLYRALGSHLGKAFQDGTHQNDFGSYELARCVVRGIRQNSLPLASFLDENVPDLDLEHPDDPLTFFVAPSPQRSTLKPDGD